MPSSVVVASRYLKHGEELFVDYRLSPDAPQLPDWYEHVDAIGARSRITGKTLEQATAATSPSTGEPATRRRLF